MTKNLHGKPYIVLLFIYWIVLAMRFACRSVDIRLLSTIAVCLVALTDYQARALLLTVPAIWLLPGRE